MEFNLAQVHEAVESAVPDRECIVFRDRRLTYRDVGERSRRLANALRARGLGAVVDRTFRAGEKVERAMIDKREMQFLYRAGEDYVFMDNTTYDQLNVGPSSLGAASNYLVESADAILKMFGDEIVGVELPAAVELNIAETEPGIQGDRVSGARKPATLETGLVVQVPLFVGPGDRVAAYLPNTPEAIVALLERHQVQTAELADAGAQAAAAG